MPRALGYFLKRVRVRAFLTCRSILGDGPGAEAHLSVRLSYRVTACARAVLGARQRTERTQKESGAREHHRTFALVIIGTTTMKEMRTTVISSNSNIIIM